MTWLKSLLPARLKSAVGAGAALTIAALAFLLRRRSSQLRSARIEVVEQKENVENEKLRAEIFSLKEKVNADEKDRLASSRLLRDILDDGNDDSGPR